MKKFHTFYKTHYRIHKSPPPLPILSQSNPVYASSSNALKIHFIIRINLPTMPRSPKWSLSIRSLHQDPLCTSPVFLTCYMSRSSHYSWFDHPYNIRWRAQIIVLLVTCSSPLSCCVVPLRPRCLPQRSTQQHSQPNPITAFKLKVFWPWHQIVLHLSVIQIETTPS